MVVPGGFAAIDSTGMSCMIVHEWKLSSQRILIVTGKFVFYSFYSLFFSTYIPVYIFRLYLPLLYLFVCILQFCISSVKHHMNGFVLI